MSVGSDLLRFSERPLLLNDDETQRLNLLADNLPFEFAWTQAVRNRVVKAHAYYLKWDDFQMSADAARITRFNPDWVRNGDDPEFVLDAWESYAKPEDPAGPIILGHNWIGFDLYIWRLLRLQLGRADLFPLSAALRRRLLDTHLLARAWKEGWKPPTRFGTDEFYCWQKKVAKAHRKGVKTGLTQMCKDLQIEVDETRTHQAAYDLFVNLQVYWGLVNQMEV